MNLWEDQTNQFNTEMWIICCLFFALAHLPRSAKYVQSTTSCLKILCMFECLEADVWTLNAGLCPAAELRCSPQMASSRVGNIFHLFSSFSVWRQFTLHCAAYLSTSLYSGELWSLGAGRWINQICRRLVHSSSTPMKGCLHPPLQSVLLSNCPFFSPCVYSSVHSSVAVSAVELQTNLCEVIQIRRRPLLP